MSSTSPQSGTFAGWFRAWVRRKPARFAAYDGLRRGLHAAKWMPYRARKSFKPLLRRGWNTLYWLPHRIAPGVWQGTDYARAAAAGTPAPIPMPLRRLRLALSRAQLVRIGSFSPVRQASAGHLAQRHTVLVPAAEVRFEAPAVFGPLPPGWPAPWPDLRVRMEPITAAEWRHATVAGKFDCVLLRRKSVVGDLWQPLTERTFDEVRRYASRNASRITYYRKRQPPLAIDRAIVMVGGPTGNWAHWTTEYLPKLALVDALPPYRDWPLVIDAELHPNIVASLELVADKRKLVRLPEGVTMRIQRAVTVGSPGYTAYEYRYDPDAGPPGFKREHTVFSPAALELVRRRAWDATGVSPGRHRRVYVTRPKGSMRPFVGAAQVENFFATLGFEIVDTSGMSAADQVRLFATTRCIVGQSGAGLANLIFAPPGCRVLVFAANSPHSIFHYFANMGSAAGHRVYYCYGEAIYEPGGHPGHAGFSIDLADVEAMWQSVLRDEPTMRA